MSNKNIKINIDKGPETEGQNKVLMELIEVVGEDLGINASSGKSQENFERCISKSLLQFARGKIIKDAVLAARYGITMQRVAGIEADLTDVNCRVMTNMLLQYISNSRYGTLEKLEAKFDKGGVFKIMKEFNNMQHQPTQH